MNTSELLAQHYYETFFGGNWSEIDYINVLKDVSFTEAVSITPASPNNIAVLVYHVNFYNKRIIERLKHKSGKANSSNGYDMSELKTEAEWNELKTEFFTTVNEAVTSIKNCEESLWNEKVKESPFTFYKTIVGVTEHAYYHLGQIVILKNTLRNNVHL